MATHVTQRNSIRSRSTRTPITANGAVLPQKGDDALYLRKPPLTRSGIVYALSAIEHEDQEFSVTDTSSAGWSGVDIVPARRSRNAPVSSSGTVIYLNQFEHPSSPAKSLTMSPAGSSSISMFHWSYPIATNSLWNFGLWSSGMDIVGISDAEGITVGTEGTPSSQQWPQTSKEENVQQLVNEALAFLSTPERERLAKRLLQLETDAKEEGEPGCSGISIPSLRNFVNFLKTNKELLIPLISLTSEGNIYASWKASLNRIFSVHFLGDSNVRFVIFRPNDKHPDKTIRLSGSATADIVVEIAAKQGFRSWAFR